MRLVLRLPEAEARVDTTRRAQLTRRPEEDRLEPLFPAEHERFLHQFPPEALPPMFLVDEIPAELCLPPRAGNDSNRADDPVACLRKPHSALVRSRGTDEFSKPVRDIFLERLVEAVLPRIKYAMEANKIVDVTRFQMMSHVPFPA